MEVSSLSNAYGAAATQSLQRQPEASEVKRAAPERDRDADDRSLQAANSTPAPTVNLNGQKVGQLINEVA